MLSTAICVFSAESALNGTLMSHLFLGTLSVSSRVVVSIGSFGMRCTWQAAWMGGRQYCV